MITVLGGKGFIGSNIVHKLKETGELFYAPGRGEDIFKKDLGDIIYSIGLTADFRNKPFETVEAHVCFLKEILQKANFSSLTYLSSTRVYINSNETEVFEDSPISISITDPDELYTLTKLTGERLCLSSGRTTKIARLSNVYGKNAGSEDFLISVIKRINESGSVKFFTTPESSKDYISIDNLCDLLVSIAGKGKTGIYNLASGENISNTEIIEMLGQYYSFKYEFDENARKIIFPRINIDKIKKEFGFSVSNPKTGISEFIKTFRYDSN